MANRRPAAILYSNGDGTASGRFPHFPMQDYELSVKGETLQLEVYDVHSGASLKKYTFDLRRELSMESVILGGDLDDSCFKAKENPTICLVKHAKTGKAKWRVERRIELDEDDPDNLI